jgi:uncharacterized OB-fold protein
MSIATYTKKLLEHKVVASRCTKCDALFLPPRPICSRCRSQDMALSELSGEGTLLGFTSIAIAPSGMVARGYGRNKPYLSGVISLKEGACVAARIEGTDAAAPEKSLKVGMTVKADFLDEGEGDQKKATLVFRPA